MSEQGNKSIFHAECLYMAKLLPKTVLFFFFFLPRNKSYSVYTQKKYWALKQTSGPKRKGLILFWTWLRIKEDLSLVVSVQTSLSPHQDFNWFVVRSLICSSHSQMNFFFFGVILSDWPPSSKSRWSVPTYTNNYTWLNVLEMSRWGGKDAALRKYQASSLHGPNSLRSSLTLIMLTAGFNYHSKHSHLDLFSAGTSS